MLEPRSLPVRPSRKYTGRVVYLVRCPPQGFKEVGSNPIAEEPFRPLSGDIFIGAGQHGSNILAGFRHTGTLLAAGLVP